MSSPVRQPSIEWVLLNYRLPREPSTPRITIWRKLKKMGAAQIVDGLVALPADARTREQFGWLADEIVEYDGQAGVWVARCTTTDQEQSLRSQMTCARVAEYNELLVTVEAAQALDVRSRRTALKRLRGQLRTIARRDFFSPPERDHAEVALRGLAESLAHVDADADVAP